MTTPKYTKTRLVNSQPYSIDESGLTEQSWSVGQAFTTTNKTTRVASGARYVCILNHTATADDEPGVGVNFETYWQLIAETWSQYQHYTSATIVDVYETDGDTPPKVRQVTGSPGSPGAAGNTILNGSSDPSAGDGVNGDFYLNTTSLSIFGPKSGGAWGSGTSLKGDKGDAGDQGPAGTIDSHQGSYNGGTAYAIGDIVLDQGSSWVALVATTGNAPPTLPTTSNTQWQLVAKQGDAGAGAVDSVNGNVGAVVLDPDDLDDSSTTNKFTTEARNDKVDHLTVSAATDLDAIRTRMAELDAAVVLKGGWDASSGSHPGGGTAQAGDSYQVTTAGTMDGIDYSINDRIIAVTDNASTTTYAGNWLKADYSDLVAEVAGLTGTITADSLLTALGLNTGDSPQFTGVNVGHASDTTVTRDSAGEIAVEGKRLLNTGDLGKQTIFIEAGAMKPEDTGGAEFSRHEGSGGDNLMLDRLLFDSSAVERAQFKTYMPKSWDAGTVQIIIEWRSTGASDQVSWEVDAVCTGDNDVFGQTFGTVVLMNDTASSTAGAESVSSAGTLTIKNAGAEKYAYFRITRQPSYLHDTSTNDAELLSVIILYNTDALNDD